MRCDICNALRQVSAEMRPSGRRDGYRYVIEEFSKHLRELGVRWTAGDEKVVSEFIELYCLADKGEKS